MKIRAQIGMVLNLDKCIGCHTCSITCKNVFHPAKRNYALCHFKKSGVAQYFL